MKGLVYFYCPLRPPNETIASGVPRIGALFVRALERAGYSVDTPDLPSSYEGSGDAEFQRRCVAEIAQAASTLVERLRDGGVRPRAWFTYHCYYKSPDLIGPVVAERIGCPYLIAEGSYAAKRATGPWAHYHALALAALARADVLFASTARDREGLERVPGSRGHIVDFPPFLDVDPFLRAEQPLYSGPVRILAAGSMDDRRKQESYEKLLSSLEMIPVGSFVLKIAGDGSGRARLEDRAKSLRKRGADIQFLGRLTPEDMPDFFANGDVYAWPGVGEAYGLTYLEAQAAGLPVVAENHGGVSECVRAGTSGYLTQPLNRDEYASALKALITNAELRKSMAHTAQQWVIENRSLSGAADRLARVLREVVR